MDYSLNVSNGTVFATQRKKDRIEFISVRTIFETLKEGDYEMIIKRKHKIRTVNQNRYYWACLGLIAVEVGYIIDEMDKETKGKIIDKLHEVFKDRFIGGEVIRSEKDKRKRLRLEPTTTDMDTQEFGEYMDKIRTLHPYLPDPNAGDDHLLQFIDLYYFK